MSQPCKLQMGNGVLVWENGEYRVTELTGRPRYVLSENKPLTTDQTVRLLERFSEQAFGKNRGLPYLLKLTSSFFKHVAETGDVHT